MDINIVFQIAAVGILVAVLNQVLIRAGSAVFGDHITEQVEKFHKAFEEV